MTQVKYSFRGIPRRVILGKERRYLKVSSLYRAKLTQNLMRLIHQAFFAKSQGEADDLGNIWKPLSPKTVDLKSQIPVPTRTGTYRVLDRDSFKTKGLSLGLLNTQQRLRWQKEFDKQVRKLKKMDFFDRVLEGQHEDIRKEAAKRAWKVIKSKDPPEVETDILIRTGALLASVAPGRVYNYRYYPPKGQEVTILTGLSIRLTLPYAKAVDIHRKIIPEVISPWVQEAHEQTMPEVKALYDSLKASYERSAAKAAKRRNSRSKTKRNRNSPRR